MKLTALCFFISGLSFCNAVYFALEYDWLWVVANILIMVLNLFNGFSSMRQQLRLAELKGQLQHHDRIKAIMDKKL